MALKYLEEHVAQLVIEGIKGEEVFQHSRDAVAGVRLQVSHDVDELSGGIGVRQGALLSHGAQFRKGFDEHPNQLLGDVGRVRSQQLHFGSVVGVVDRVAGKDVPHFSEEIVAEDGSVQTVSTDSFFQVIATAQDSLLKTVKTHVKTEQNRLRESHKAISLQYLEVWRRDAPDSITAFYAEEPRWVDMLDVGRFASLILHLKSWSCGPSHTDGCVELTLPKLVYTRYSVDDLDCPVALKLLQLWRNGWSSHNWLNG